MFKIAVVPNANHLKNAILKQFTLKRKEGGRNRIFAAVSDTSESFPFVWQFHDMEKDELNAAAKKKLQKSIPLIYLISSLMKVLTSDTLPIQILNPVLLHTTH